MTEGRTAAVVVLGLLLTTTLALGNVVFAAHVTVLGPEFAKETIEAEDGFDALAGEFESAIAADVGLDANASETTEGQVPAEPDSMEALLRGKVSFDDVVSEGYVAGQLSANLDRYYAYLHGTVDELNLSIDASPIIENVSVATEAAMANTSTGELFASAAEDPFAGVPLDRETVDRLDEGPDEFRAAQVDVRSDVREAVLDSAVNESYREWSNDRLLALVIPDFDPRDYSEDEKERMVTDRKGEIKQALRQEIETERSEEIEAEVDKQLAALAASAKDDEIETGTPGADEPANELQAAVAAALAGEIDHATYRKRANAARGDLATAAGEEARRQMTEELGTTIDLNEAMEIDRDADLGGVVAAVTWIDRLAVVLPVLGLGLIGLIYGASRSVGRTLGTVGWSALWAGLPAFVGAVVLGDRLPSMLGAGGDPSAGGDPGAMQSLMLAIFERTLGHVSIQSLAIGVVGLGLVGVALAMRYDLLDRVRGDGGGGGGGSGASEEGGTIDGTAVETDASSDPLADRAPGGGQVDSADSGASQHEDR